MGLTSVNNLPFPYQWQAKQLLGSASSNSTITLSDSLSNYQWIAILGVGGTVYRGMHFIPVSLFKQGNKWYLGSNDNASRRISVKSSTDTKIVVADRTSLNVYIYGVK